MKTAQNFGIYYLLMVIAQIVISNYFLVSPLVTITILPALILCIPGDMKTPLILLIAFATGLSADLLSEGVLGLNTLSLLPVALVKKTIMRAFFDRDSVERGTGFSFRRNGALKISLALITVISLFLIIYIAADGAGTREFIYNLSRFALSLLSSLIISLVCVHILTEEKR